MRQADQGAGVSGAPTAPGPGAGVPGDRIAPDQEAGAGRGPPPPDGAWEGGPLRHCPTAHGQKSFQRGYRITTPRFVSLMKVMAMMRGSSQKTSCTWSTSNEVRRHTRSRYKLPRVEATRTPHLDHFIHPLAPQTAKVVDRELSRIQTFVLDSLAPSLLYSTTA